MRGDQQGIVKEHFLYQSFLFGWGRKGLLQAFQLKTIALLPGVQGIFKYLFGYIGQRSGKAATQKDLVNWANKAQEEKRSFTSFSGNNMNN